MGKYDIGEELTQGATAIGRAYMRRESLDRQERALGQQIEHQDTTEKETFRYHKALEAKAMEDLAVKKETEKRNKEVYEQEQARRAIPIDVLAQGDLEHIKDSDPNIYNTKILPMLGNIGNASHRETHPSYLRNGENRQSVCTSKMSMASDFKTKAPTLRKSFYNFRIYKWISLAWQRPSSTVEAKLYNNNSKQANVECGTTASFSHAAVKKNGTVLGNQAAHS